MTMMALGLTLHDKLDDLLDMRRIEEVAFCVVIRRCGDNHEVGIAVGRSTVGGGREV